MKRLVIATISLLFATGAIFANENRPDTIMSINNPDTITITDSREAMKIVVKGNDADENFRYTFEEKYSDNVKIKSNEWIDYGAIRIGNKNCDSKDDIIISGLCIGLVNANGAPAQAGFELGKSWEISLVNMLAYRRRIAARSFLSIGFGMDWRTYRNSKGNTRFMLDDQGKVMCGAFPEGVQARGSQIKVVRAGFPIMWHQNIGRRANFKLGVILNMTTHASMSSKWVNEAGNEVKEYNGDINTRFFTVDLIGVYKFNNWIGVYGRWTPQSVLRTSGNASPDFSSLSFGITTLF